MERMWLLETPWRAILALNYLFYGINNFKNSYDYSMSNDCLILNGNGKPLSYFPLSACRLENCCQISIY